MDPSETATTGRTALLVLASLIAAVLLFLIGLWIGDLGGEQVSTVAPQAQAAAVTPEPTASPAPTVAPTLTPVPTPELKALPEMLEDLLDGEFELEEFFGPEGDHPELRPDEFFDGDFFGPDLFGPDGPFGEGGPFGENGLFADGLLDPEFQAELEKFNLDDFNLDDFDLDDFNLEDFDLEKFNLDDFSYGEFFNKDFDFEAWLDQLFDTRLDA